MSARASCMLRQTPVPTSTTDWCISGFTRSCSSRLPFAMISASMCERRSRVTGSMVWYSSSMPMVKLGRLHVLSPCSRNAAQRYVERRRGGSSAFRTASSATAFDDPLEVVLADRVQVGVGRRVHEVDGVRHAVLDGELDGVQVVAERPAERERVALDAVDAAPGRTAGGFLHVALVDAARADRSGMTCTFSCPIT